MAQKSLLREGQIINHDGQDLQVIKSLSSGLTGEVYRACLTVSRQSKTIDVVVKAMKALDFPLARQLFYKEGETLAFLMHLEEETKDLLDGDLKIAPVYYGLSEYQPDPESPSFPYLVMEFIAGRQVPEILKEQKTISEAQALTIAWHLYRILDILHTHLLKTFIDLKFENLWWVENDGKWGGQLKVTDFGTLEEIKPGDEKKRGIARDILLGGVYLLSMLTGYKLDYSIGELKESARPVINRFEEKMTWGTRRLLRKLLHSNAEARYTSAAEVLTELHQLVNFWSQSSDRLSDMAQRNLAAAEWAAEEAMASKQPLTESGLAAARRAYSALDILRSKDPQLFNESDIQRVESVLSIGDYFERGYALLQGRSFTLARQTFEEGMRWTDEPAILRRWAYAARIGEEIPPKDFEERFAELKSLLDFLNDDGSEKNEKKWQSALGSLEELESTALGKPSLGSKGLGYLIAECKLYDFLERAESSYFSGNFSEASEWYGATKNVLEKDLPPEAAKLIDEEIGSLAEMRRNAESHSGRERSLQLYHQAKELLEQEDLKDVLKTAYEAYEADKYAPFRFEKLTELAQLALQLGGQHSDNVEEYIRLSRHIVDIAIHDFGDERDISYERLCQASAKFDKAIQNITETDSLTFCNLLEEAYGLLDNNSSLVEAIAVHAASLTKTQPTFLRGLADCIEGLLPASVYPERWRAIAAEAERKQTEGISKQVDKFLREAYYTLLPLGYDAKNLKEILDQTVNHSGPLSGWELLSLRDRLARLEQAKVLLEKSLKLTENAENNRRDEIVSLHKVISDRLEPVHNALAAQSRAQQQERQARLSALSKQRIQIEQQLKWVKQGLRLELDAGTNISRLRQELLNFLYRCYEVKAGNPEGLQEAVQRQKILRETGEDVITTAAPSLDTLVNWATHALLTLDGKPWENLADLVKEQTENYGAELKKANEAFENGNLGLVAGILDHTRADLESTPEWQTLKSKLTQANAWKAWWESKSERYKSSPADQNLLRDLRAYVNLGLPAIYWEQTSADQYLKDSASELEAEIKDGVKFRVHDEQFVEAIRALLSVAWTKRLATSSQERQNWDPANWLQQSFNLAYTQDAKRLTDHIYQTLPPEDVEQALNSINHRAWEQLQWEHDRKERERKEADQKRHGTVRPEAQPKERWVWLAGAIVLGLCIVLAVASYFFNRANPGLIWLFAKDTNTPAPTRTPAPTFTPSLTPTVTVTPTETPTPTPVPPSQFLLPIEKVNALYPLPPVIGDAHWLIDDSAALLSHPVESPDQIWQAGTSKDKNANNEKFIYTLKGNTSVTWPMDVPVDATGYYQIFVLDTQAFSSQSQVFNVLVDRQPVPPYRGTNQVIFQDAGQATDVWLSLGVYPINAGQTVTVQIVVSELTDKTPFAVDRLLIVRLNSSTQEMLDKLPAGRTLVSLLDDPGAIFMELVGGKEPKLVQDRGTEFKDALAWNGSFRSRTLAEPLTVPVWVDWVPANRLAPGKYEVYVWVPAQHATIAANYAFLADGNVVERSSPAPMNQADHAGAWVTLGQWDLLQEASVNLRMIVEAGTIGDIGVDAIAILKVEQ